MPVEIHGIAPSQVTIILKVGSREVTPDPDNLYSYRFTDEEEQAYELLEPISVISDGEVLTVQFPIVQENTDFTVSDIVVTNVTDRTATIQFVTSIPVVSKVDYGTVEDEHDNIGQYLSARTVHSHTLTGLTPLTDYYADAIMPGQTVSVRPFRTFATNRTPEVVIQNNGAVLTSSTATIDWTDSNPSESRFYEVYVNGQIQGLPLQFPTTELLKEDFPVNGSLINIVVRYYNESNPDFYQEAVAQIRAHEAVTGGVELAFLEQPTYEVEDQSTAIAAFTANDYVNAFATGRAGGGELIQLGSHTSNFDYDSHRLRLRNLVPDTTYTDVSVRIVNEQGAEVISDVGTFQTPAEVVVVDPGGGGGGGGGGTQTFAQIEAGGLNYAVYTDPDDDLEELQYAAEYCYQNQATRYFSVNMTNKTVSALPVPTPPNNAVQMPPPSGSFTTDTNRLQNLIQTGARIEGNPNGGRYKISGLNVNSSDVRIWNLPFTTGDSVSAIRVTAADFRMYDSCAYGQSGTSKSAIAIELESSARRCHLINGGYQDVRSNVGNNRNVIGVEIQGADEFYIAGCVFKNLQNISGDTRTHRANAIRLNGANTHALPRGKVVNCYGENFESNGKLEDSEFLNHQSHTSGSRTIAQSVVMMGCVLVSAGKRGTKSQDNGFVCLSNSITWDTRSTEIGPSVTRRLRLHIVSIQTGSNGDLFFRHNRVRIEGSARWGVGFNHELRTNSSNIHIDRNDWYIQNTPSFSGDGYFARFRPPSDSARIYSTPNCTLENNVIRGPGGTVANYRYYFDNTFDDWNIQTNQFLQTGNPSNHKNVQT